MIPKFILKAIVSLIEKMFYELFDKQAKIFKFQKNLDYTELPNDVDRGLKKLEDEVSILTGTVKDMVKDIHPPAIDLKEWAEVKDAIKKVQNMKFKTGL